MISRIITTALVLLASSLAFAGRPSPAVSSGLGELSLDPGAIAAIVRAGIPGPIPISIPGAGEVSVLLEAPSSVRFVEGGVETSMGVALVELGMRGRVMLRLEPELLPKSGRIRLRATRAVAEGKLSLLPDLAPLLPAVELPRTFEWLAPEGGHPHTRLSLYLQGVEITPERFVLRFSLSARPYRR